MAELLIYNGTHWMDKLTPTKFAAMREKYPDWDQQYAQRYQKGHVVEIRPDGFWSKAGRYPRKDVFRVLLLPGVSVQEVQYLLDAGRSERRCVTVDTGRGKDLATVSELAGLKVTVRDVKPLEPAVDG